MTQPQTEIVEADSEESAPELAIPPEEKPSRIKQFFARPHLPKSLVLTAVLLILTNIFVILINQPTIYWIDYKMAESTSPVLYELLVVNPFLFVGVAVVYLILVWLALAFLPRFPALVIWMSLCFIHLRDVIWWIDCGARGIYYNESNSNVCQATNFTLAIVGSAILGLVLANAWFRIKPPVTGNVKSGSVTTTRLSKKAIFGSLVWVALLTFVLIRATNIPANGWQPVVMEVAPSPRIDGKVVFDSNRGKAVLFGGATGWVGEDQWITENDTWEWDGITWIQKFPEISPPARTSHALAFDEARGVTVLFGGKDQQVLLNGTWEWDGEQWVEFFPQNTPPARCCHQMYYDSEFGTVRIFGGYDGEIFYDDMWEWDGVNWQQIMADTPSPVASGYGRAYDRDHHQLVTLLAGFPDGTWLFQGNRWADPPIEIEPSSRSNVGMEYDRKIKKSVLFGGSQDSRFLNETWILGTEWEEYDSPLDPSPRWGHNFFYDTTQDRIIMFGGFDGTNYLNDMWMFVFEE